MPGDLVLDAPDQDNRQLRRLILAGLVVILAYLTGFGGWALFASLDSAVIARGVVAADSRRKTVQHKEGGILRQLFVAEGDAVRSGQPLARLDTTQADATIGQLAGQLIAVQARLVRLRAERDGAAELIFPPQIAARRGEPLVDEAVRAQEALFDSRRQANDSKAAIIEGRILQLKEHIRAAQAQLSAVEKRLVLTEEEASNVSFLLQRGYERRPRLLELQRSIEDLRGRRGELGATIAQAHEAIASAEMELKNLRDTLIAEIAKELEDGRAQEVDLTERLRAAEDVRDRLTIVAPQDGIVVDLRLVTPGAVLAAGQALMDIVPSDDDLIIEAQVQPNDIEVLRVGQPVRVRLTAYKSTLAPSLEGEVIFVSADQMVDDQKGLAFFKTRIRLKADSLAQNPHVRPVPGMPAEVMIITGERRAFDYFVAPIRDRMRRAFRET
jgi:HlyD family secretion protein